MSGVVTPEAVRLEFEPAGIGSRAVALLVDLLVQGLTIAVLLVAQNLAMQAGGTAAPGWVATTIALLLSFGVLWGYPVGFETLWGGRTPGKAAMGLRVVTVEGAPVRFRHAAIRAALSLVDFWLAFGGVAVISALVSRNHQRLGDLVAGTLVLRERTGAPPPTAVRFAVPAGAEPYAATIDPSGLTADDYATARRFLLRASHLADDVRADLARRIARPLAARLRHSPPDWVSPELFLLCAAARFQERGGAAAPPPSARADGASATAPMPEPPAPSPPSPPSEGGFAPPG